MQIEISFNMSFKKGWMNLNWWIYGTSGREGLMSLWHTLQLCLETWVTGSINDAHLRIQPHCLVIAWWVPTMWLLLHLIALIVTNARAMVVTPKLPSTPQHEHRIPPNFTTTQTTGRTTAFLSNGSSTTSDSEESLTGVQRHRLGHHGNVSTVEEIESSPHLGKLGKRIAWSSAVYVLSICMHTADAWKIEVVEKTCFNWPKPNWFNMKTNARNAWVPGFGNCWRNPRLI